MVQLQVEPRPVGTKVPGIASPSWFPQHRQVGCMGCADVLLVNTWMTCEPHMKMEFCVTPLPADLPLSIRS